MNQRLNRGRIGLTLFLILLWVSSPLWAAAGKIVGRVIDKESGDPLPGVNVLIEGTSMGAATDIDGNYLILNVPPGTYTLRASYIGYATTHIENVRASIDQTTRQNFSLSTEVIAGEEVTIVAERPLVQKDLTASQKTTTAEEIQALPVESFVGVLTTQAGVNQGADGALHIRGGRSTEVGYFVDGVPVTNPFFTNSLATNVSNKALEEMKVVSGAFNAEYGNAMSGIVNIRLKEGRERYAGSLSYYTGDYISNDEDIFYHIDNVEPFANSVVEGTINGPIPLTGKKLTFNSSIRYNDNEGWLYGQREHLPADSADFRDSDNWYIELGGDNEFVPMNNSIDMNMMHKLTWRINPSMKLSGQMLYDNGESKSYVHSYRYNPEGTLNYFSDNYNYSVKFSHVFGKSFYEANLFYSTTDYRSYKFEDPLDPRYVPTTRVRGTPTSATFNFGGMQMGHNYRDSESRGGRFDFTSQINLRHEIKTGVMARIDDLNETIFTVLYDNQEYREPTVKPANESPSHVFYDNEAIFFSGYVQDKIEYEDMIINAGVRYDYFDPQAEYLVDLVRPDQSERKQADPKQMVSPRLGVSFPITDRGILHFSYGHFYQMPPLRRLYLEDVFGAGTSPSIGYANLKPEKTVIYEFGLQQQLDDYLALEVSMFAKDIRDLLALQSIRYESAQFGPSSYNVFLNKDYGAVKGITLSLTKRHDAASKITAWVDYTFQRTDGNDVRSGAFFFSAISGVEEEKRIVPLNWDQRHILNATVTLSEPGSWGISFIGRMSSGWPYTPVIPFANYVPDPNSERKPWQRTVDLHAYKNIRMGKIGFVFFVKAFNVFDTLNERYVFDDTGRAGYTFWNRSAQETQEFIRHYGEPGVHTWEEYQTRPHYYRAPRLVQAGVSLEF
jgi:outer membrane receptor protein involved in Fe transport